MNDPIQIAWRGRDGSRLARMRALFLARSEDGEPAATEDYWVEPRDLELYDSTYGARIGWKWDSVLAEAQDRGLAAPSADATVVDWGCGTGVAARRVAAAGLLAPGTKVQLFDRSSAARAFAVERLRESAPDLHVRSAAVAPTEAPDLLLVSHVISELKDADLGRLVDLAAGAAQVVWVEPGARPIARRLVEARERLLRTHVPLAPCPHAGPCGTLAAGAEDQWCHHFPEPPQEAFIEGFWARFSKELEIDRRSLATSFLVLARRDTIDVGADDPTRARVLGRARIEKGKALVNLCDAGGVNACELWKRDAPRVWRTWKKPSLAPLAYRLEREGLRIRRVLEGPGVETSESSTEERA